MCVLFRSFWILAIPLMVMGCNPTSTSSTPDQETDQDGDGWTACPEWLTSGTDAFECDCDDQDPSVNLPAAFYEDVDQDGYGLEQATWYCDPPVSTATQPGDCDDTDGDIHPGAEEWCDQVDNDCDGQVDEGAEDVVPLYPDQDGDGHGDAALAMEDCPGLEGYSTRNDDCDDTQAEVYPGAIESCDGLDNDCDEAIDEAQYFWDEDGDGFGDETRPTSCASADDSIVPARGDCDDSDATIHPGAEDGSSDGVDQDCGGTNGADAHVGLSEGSASSLETGILDALTGTTVWVGPGQHLAQGLSFGGKRLTLRATHLEEVTILDGGGTDRILELDGAEDPGSILDGFTFTGGSGPRVGGGAIRLQGTGLTLRQCRFTDNQTGEQGGAIFARESELWLETVSFQGNTAGSVGGALYLDTSEASIVDVTFSDNEGTSGGGITAMYTSLDMAGVQLAGNRSAGDGGGLYLFGGEGTFRDILLEGNTAGDDGGGAYIEEASPSWEELEALDNLAYDGGGAFYLVNAGGDFLRAVIRGNAGAQGGGLFVLNSSPSLTNALIVGNLATDNGGGLFLRGANPSLVHATIADNRAAQGGGVYADSATPRLTSSVLAYNFGLNYFAYDEAATPILEESALYNIGLSHNLDTLDDALWPSVPGFAALVPDGVALEDDFHLAYGSSLRDTLPDENDPDGSAGDMGAYGGPEGDFSYYDDADGDGLPDGWERRQGLDPEAADGQGDPDGDGATNLAEYQHRLDPNDGDTDDDGATDGEEIAAGSDGNDWSLRPGVEGRVIIQVPSDFPTIQAAIDAVTVEGSIILSSGTYSESVVVGMKRLTLQGAGADATFLEPEGARGITVDQTTLNLSGVAIGKAGVGTGGGVAMRFSDGLLEAILFTGNQATEGGALRLAHASATVVGCTFLGNSADDGGAIFATDSSLILEESVLQDNLGTNGGALFFDQGEIRATGCQLLDNSATSDGGGARLYDVGGEFQNCLFDGNMAVQGGGMDLYYSGVTLDRVWFQNNEAYGLGGGLNVNTGDPILSQCVFANNVGDIGGGLHLSYTAPRLEQVCVVGNTAVEGGGIWLFDASPQLEGVLLAYNTPGNLLAEAWAPGSPVVAYSDLYAAEGEVNHNLETLDSSNITVEPGLLAYGADGIPTELHLASGSPLVDAGDPAGLDVDGTRADIGCYGGPSGDLWDLDRDGYPAYFWPGALEDAPAPFQAGDYDRDDFDADRH